MTNRNGHTKYLALAAGLSTAILVGCSKPESETPSTAPPKSEKSATSQKPAPSKPTTPTIQPSTPAKPTVPVPGSASPTKPGGQPPAGSAPVDSDAGKEAAELNNLYGRATDMGQKLDIMYRATDLPPYEAVAAIGRMFRMETDPELKSELLFALSDIDDQNDAVLTILTDGIRANQPQEVREAAIDGMATLEDQRAIGILQPLLNDPNEDIRDAAKDAIETLQMAQSSP